MPTWESRTWQGLETLQLRGDTLEVEVLPGYGGQVRSLVYRPAGLELLRTPKTLDELQGRPFLFGIPVLFLPGRLRGGEFTLGGRTYRWPLNERGVNHLHGFVWGKPWQSTVADGVLTVAFTAARESAEAEAFGHPFRLAIAYRVRGGELSVRAEVENLDDAAMPLGLGYHTTLSLVDGQGQPLAYTAQLPAGREWEMGSDVMPTGRLGMPEKFARWVQGGQRLWEVVSDNLFLVDGEAENAVTMELEQPRLSVKMTGRDPFRNWVVYRPALDAPFISIEPVSWVHNAPNLSQPAEFTGVRLLEGHEHAVFEYLVALSPT